VIAVARRTGRTAAVALADLDRFKVVNDRHGHAAGDEVLRHTGGLLRRSFRANDVIARYGGEEFLIVFPEIDPRVAFDRIERFRASFAAAGPALPVPAALTLSIGMAAYPADGETVADLLGRADERLYAAKQAGRNRVQGWSGKPSS
jgi:diguanylate cyclase (GGDEF)-like protein